MSKYSHTIKQQALDLYRSGLSGPEIEKILNIPAKTVHYWARSIQITRHRGPKSKIEKEDYFSNITTEEQSYWLGWIAADGCISTYNNQHSLKLHIALKDRILVDSFLRQIRSKNSFSIRDNSIYVSLTSRKMIEDLIQLGIEERKSGKEQYPIIPSTLNKHFIRGYFDGDGITSIGPNSAYRSGFCGGEDILHTIQSKISLYPTIRPCRGTYYFHLSAKNSNTLYHYMYDEATIWLPRKRNRMKIICGNTEVISSLNKLETP